MDKLLSRAKWIRNVGIAEIVFLVISIILTIILFNKILLWNPETEFTISYTLIALVFVDIISLFVLCILQLIASIYILATDWKLPNLNNDKIVWGILALLVLPIISLIVFGQKAVSSLSFTKNTTPTSAQTEIKSQNIEPKVEDNNW